MCDYTLDIFVSEVFESDCCWKSYSTACIELQYSIQTEMAMDDAKLTWFGYYVHRVWVTAIFTYTALSIAYK